VVVVDTSGWLAYFTDEQNAAVFAGAIERPEELIVPTVTLYEAYRHVLPRRGEQAALQVVALMRRGAVVDLDGDLALEAAGLGITHRLAFADSVILATARRVGASLWTQDRDFDGLEGVRYVPRS
jgi:predicted nucleic acid-binding protein